MSTTSPILNLTLPASDGSDPFSLADDFLNNWAILDASPGVLITAIADLPTLDNDQIGRLAFISDMGADFLLVWDGVGPGWVPPNGNFGDVEINGSMQGNIDMAGYRLNNLSDGSGQQAATAAQLATAVEFLSTGASTLELSYNGNGPTDCQVLNGLSWNPSHGGLVFIVIPAALCGLGEDVPAFAYVDTSGIIEWFSYLASGSLVGYDANGNQIGTFLSSANGNATLDPDGSFVIDAVSYNWVFSPTENSLQFPTGYKLWFANLVSDLVGSGQAGDTAVLSNNGQPIFAINFGGTWEQYAPAAAGGPTVRAFPFDYTTGDVNSFYTPQSGEILLNAWVEVDVAWNGTTPKADIFLSQSSVGMLSSLGFTIDLTQADSDAGQTQLLNNLVTYASLDLATAQVYAIGPSIPATPVRCVPAKILDGNVFEIVVSQDGNRGHAGEAVGTTVTLPVTISAGVNDTFVVTCSTDSSSPETFTIPPGTYNTISELSDAVNLATGTTSDNITTVLNPSVATFSPPVLRFDEVTAGLFNNADTITEGNGGAAAIGFIGTVPFTGGTGGATGSTQGSGVIYIETVVPKAGA